MAAATKVTNKGVGMAADRLRTTPATYTTAPKFVGVGTAGTTAAVTDTALGTEVETRATGTESIVTTTATGDTMQVVGTVTATATRAITECGTFDASTVGNMGISATISSVGLASGDSIQLTFKWQFTTS